MIFTAIGLAGGSLACALYYLLTKGVITAKSRYYLFGQLLTTILMLISLSASFNAGAVFINAFWLLITIIAIAKGVQHEQ